MLRKLIFIMLLVFLRPVPAQAEPLYGVNETAQLTLDFFISACFQHTHDLADWANNNKTLDKVEIRDPESFKTMGSRYGYPKEEDPTLNMWNIHGTYIVLLQLQNRGCTVISDAVIAPDAFRYWLESFSQYIEKQTAYRTRIEMKNATAFSGTNTLLTINPDSQGNKVYILSRLYPKGAGGASSTRIFYFESQQEVAF